MFNNKKDPLVDAVKKIMEQNEKEREALKSVNEAFGVHSKKALPHELHGKYDAMLEEAKKCMYEEGKDRKFSPKQEKLAAKAGDEEDKTLEEAKATKAQEKKVAEVMREYKKRKLHSGSKKGPKVTKEKQALAIAMSQAGLSNKKKMDESNSFNLVQEEIRINLLERINYIYENEGEDAANAFIETLSEEEIGILGEVFGNTENMTWRQRFRAQYNRFGEGEKSQPVDGVDPSNPPKAPTPRPSIPDDRNFVQKLVGTQRSGVRDYNTSSNQGDASKDLETGVTPAPAAPAAPASSPAIAPKPAAPSASSTTSSLGQELRRVGGNAPATSDTAGGRAKIDAMDKAKPMRNWRDDAFNAGGGA